MTTWATRGAQALLILGALGCLGLQTALALSEIGRTPREGLGIAVAILGVLFVVCVEIAIVCLWRLLTFVRTDVIFSTRAFRFVDVIVACCVAAGALVLTVAALLAPLPDSNGPAPGVILLIGVFGAGVWGIGLLVVVMRGLLRRAIEWRDELEVVI